MRTAKRGFHLILYGHAVSGNVKSIPDRKPSMEKSFKALLQLHGLERYPQESVAELERHVELVTVAARNVRDPIKFNVEPILCFLHPDELDG
ncbi:hypothetical protein [Caballeronia sp. LZ001]|uniref:hypothetical protein n=1 Tax=Caballeronia sp. LZ001 TaxID=3038553 RepID=UPI0028583E29|nr:hypothetical protein [Caballeronia sp. LZ001]MDR5804770.1 hypothetical protein [Caballeronia sp. LZ001]